MRWSQQCRCMTIACVPPSKTSARWCARLPQGRRPARCTPSTAPKRPLPEGRATWERAQDIGDQVGQCIEQLGRTTLNGVAEFSGALEFKGDFGSYGAVGKYGRTLARQRVTSHTVGRTHRLQLKSI